LRGETVELPDPRVEFLPRLGDDRPVVCHGSAPGQRPL
jgi:hypothetical protein